MGETYVLDWLKKKKKKKKEKKMSFSMLRLLKLLSSGRPGYAVEILNERHQKEWFCNSFYKKLQIWKFFFG